MKIAVKLNRLLSKTTRRHRHYFSVPRFHADTVGGEFVSFVTVTGAPHGGVRPPLRGELPTELGGRLLPFPLRLRPHLPAGQQRD